MSRLLKQHEILHPEYIPRERDINTSSNSSLNLSNNTSISAVHQQLTTSSQNETSADPKPEDDQKKQLAVLKLAVFSIIFSSLWIASVSI
jgi:hypothetical protein